jgi:hypothetical protein
MNTTNNEADRIYDKFFADIRIVEQELRSEHAKLIDGLGRLQPYLDEAHVATHGGEIEQ